MNTYCKYDEFVKISEIKSHPKNRNKHSKEQIERLAEILQYQGWRYPIKISKQSGFVTSGHGRIEAAKLNKWDKVPVNYQEYESEEQEYADVVADNAIASWAELELNEIKTDLISLNLDFDIDLLGIQNFSLDTDKGLTDEDSVPEIKGEARTKMGDLYLLGNHRILCGDSTDKAQVEKLMNGEKADMVFTDPPYNLNFKYNSYQDDKSDSEYLSFCGAWYSVLKIVTTNIIITPGTKNLSMWCKIEDPLHVACWVKKNWITSCKISNLQQWEPILFYGDFKRNRSSDIYEHTRVYQEDVGDNHPCPKQVSFVEDILKHYSKNAVLDVFLGSGTTLIACEKTNRKCFGMEIDPHYCDVIIERWQKYTGKIAIREDGVKYPSIQ